MLISSDVTIDTCQFDFLYMKAMIERKRLCNGIRLEAKTNRNQYYHDQTHSQGDPPNLIQSISSIFDNQFTSR
jgi:hypothetical protein